MSFAAAQKAANRIIEKTDAQFEDLKKKALALQQQLVDISQQVTQIRDQLKEIEKAVKALREKVV